MIFLNDSRGSTLFIFLYISFAWAAHDEYDVRQVESLIGLLYLGLLVFLFIMKK